MSKSSTIVEFKKPAALRIVCSKCHAAGDAPCNCGAPFTYMRAGEIAAAAVARSPEKSDRAIAAEIGVSHPTVAKAREATGNNLPVEKRTGIDGKARSLPQRSADDDDEHDDDDCGMAPPEEIRSNVLDTLERHKAVARGWRRVIKNPLFVMPYEMRGEISGAIDALMKTWTSAKRALEREPGGSAP